jgi:hypothetical protein
MAGVSLYWHDPAAHVYACDDATDALIPDYLGAEYVKRGKWVSDPEFLKAHAEAWANHDAPGDAWQPRTT